MSTSYTQQRIVDAINNLTRVIESVGFITKQDFIEMENRIMSAISDFGAAVQASFTKVSADLDSISSDITALNALITKLQSSPGAITPADQAVLDQIQAAGVALAAKADAAVPAPLPPVPPTPPGP